MKSTLTAATLALGTVAASAQEQRPNILLINADDIGYGDLSCYGMTRIQTPNVDRLAQNGIRFTNAHTTSATSTPSRYGMLTGTYPWRTPDTAVASGDAAMIIKPEKPTIADMLKSAGYNTAVIGKWHLGIGDTEAQQDWNGTITPGLEELGFDHYVVMAATGDRVPCVYIENGKVRNLDPNDPISVSYKGPFEGEPTGYNNPEMLRIHPSHDHDQAIVDSISRIGYMKGGKSALWKDELIADVIVEDSKKFIINSVKNSPDKPFFLYMATNDIHVPRVPHWRFKDKSGMGYRGDALLSFDWSVGQVVATLDSLGIRDNTLIILTSDNGPVLDDGYKDQAIELVGEHDPSAGFRGGKYSAYTAGTRVPLIVNWPDGAKRSKVSKAMISQVDFFATLSALVGQSVEKGVAKDSQNFIDVLLSASNKGREIIVLDAYTRAYINGDWKYIRPSHKSPVAWETGIETGNNPEPQLFNLKKDPKEEHNLASENPEIVARLEAELQAIEKK